MENAFYGVERSSEYLAHYGIKGMKWGVRKAIERGNERALARQYKKAQKKLSKLNARADIETQSKRAKRFGTAAGITGALGLSGAGISIPVTKQLRGINAKGKELDATRKKLIDMQAKNIIKEADFERQLLGAYGSNPSKYLEESAKANAMNSVRTQGRNINRNLNQRLSENAKAITENRGKAELARRMQLGSAALGAAGLVAGGITGGKALAAKYRTTKKGHAKAVAKRDAWQREMNRAFAGTKYGKRR